MPFKRQKKTQLLCFKKKTQLLCFKKKTQLLKWSNSDSFGHLVFSGDFSTNYKSTFNDFIPRIEDFYFLITLTGSERLEYIQREQFEKFYTNGAQITSFLRTNPLFETTKRIFTVKRNTYRRYILDDISSKHKYFQLHKSFGDDIDDFYDRIKTKDVTYKNGRELETAYRGSIPRLWIYQVYNSPEYSQAGFGKIGHIGFMDSFHLSMLTETEEVEMCSNSFKNETALSKNMQNYALSLCARETYYYDYSQRMIWDIEELDPWQEQNPRKKVTKSKISPLFKNLNCKCQIL